MYFKQTLMQMVGGALLVAVPLAAGESFSPPTVLSSAWPAFLRIRPCALFVCLSVPCPSPLSSCSQPVWPRLPALLAVVRQDTGTRHDHAVPSGPQPASATDGAL